VVGHWDRGFGRERVRSAECQIVQWNDVDAIDRAGWHAQLTAGTNSKQDGVHLLRCTDDSIHWTRLNA